MTGMLYKRREMKPKIEYVPDCGVDDAVDLDIRGLLTTCFTKTQDVVFKERRYFREPYPHRWGIFEGDGTWVAHIGVHEKQIQSEDETFSVGGICEVCVHPDYRGKGYVKMMLECVHGWLSEHGFAFAMLFGNPLVYSSSGYAHVENLFNGSEDKGWKPAAAMVYELSETPWPSGTVYMPGPKF